MNEGVNYIGRQVESIRTSLYVCTSCSRSFTIPFNDQGDGVGECERCGCTSYTIKEGRKWGTRHRFWKDWVKSLYRLDDTNRVTPETMNCFYEPSELPEYLNIRESEA